MDDYLWTVKEFCEKYAVSRFMVYRWVSLGLVPHIRFKKVIRFRPQDLEGWKKNNSAGTVTDDLL